MIVSYDSRFVHHTIFCIDGFFKLIAIDDGECMWADLFLFHQDRGLMLEGGDRRWVDAVLSVPLPFPVDAAAYTHWDY